MVKRKKQVVLFIIAFMLMVACVPMFISADVNAESTVNLFYANSVQIKTHVQVPTDKITGDTRYGALIVADANGDSVTLRNEVVGKFEIDFTSFSQQTFSGDVSSSVYENDYADLQELTFKFRDLDNSSNSFDVVFTPGYAGNLVTPTAKIRARGEEAGIVSLGGTLRENTGIANANGTFTAIEGASFSNLAYTSGTSTNKVQSIVLSFDPDTMCVYVKPNGGMESLVWNFFNSVNDARDLKFTLEKMKRYTVEIEFSKILAGSTANLMVYSVLGRDSSWHYLANDEKVGIVTDVDFNGVVNTEYKIPVPQFSENVSSGTVSVIGPISNETFTLTANTTFTPIFAGKYSIIYNVISDKGVATSYEYSIDVFDTAPSGSFEYNKVFYEEDFGVGSTVALPKVVATGGLLKADADALLTVLRNGVAVEDFIKVGLVDTFTFNEEGEYTIVFSSPCDTFYEEYTFNVLSSLPNVQSLPNLADVAIGESVILPDLNASANGIKCDYSLKIKTPSGRIVTEKQFVADEAGVYEVEYVTQNPIVSYKRYFSALTKTVDAFTSSESRISTELGSAWYNNRLSGLIVSSESGFNAQYYNTIDLSNNTKDDVLLEFAVIPSKVGEANFEELLLTFTDVFDEENYFTLDVLSGVRGGDRNHVSYLKGSATDQVRTGMGSSGNVYIGGNYGTYSHFSFFGTFPSSEDNNKTLKVYYDYNEKAIYVNFQRENKVKVIDFDDPNCFANVWGGLTNGMVNLSVQVLGYKSGVTSIVFQQVDGFDFTKEFLYTNEKPIITVNTLGYNDANLPNAVVGVEYPLFSANAYSKLQGALEVNREVYLNYNTDTQQLIDVQNGFVPTVAGAYTIVYSVIDGYGTKSEKTLAINCIAQANYNEITSNISSADNKGLFVGQRDVVKSIQASGGIGNLTSQVTITNGESEVAISPRGEFILETAGEYVVTYKVTDFLKTEKIFSYVIDCTISNKPIINDEANLPYGFIRGFDYTLPDLVCYDYSVGGTKKRASTQILILDSLGKTLETLGANRVYTPKEEHGDIVTIRYFIGGTNGFSTKEYDVKIFDAIDVENYEVNKTELFNVNNVSQVTATEGYVSFTMQNDGKIDFINDLTENNVSFILGGIVDGDNDLRNVKITLSDSVTNQAISFNITIAQDVMRLTTLDGAQQFEITELISYDYVGYKLIYSRLDRSIRNELGVQMLTFDKADNGEAFSGFTSGKVRVSFSVSSVTGAPKLVLTEIGNYFLDNQVDDYSPPQINFNNEIKGYVVVGSTVAIPSATVADVVSPTSTCVVTVTLKGVAVLDEKGNELNQVNAYADYSFKPMTVGNYLVTYTFTDCFGNSNEYKKSINVVEKNSPTITLNDGVKAKGKVGSKYKIPTFSATDDVTAEENVVKKIYMISPTGTFYEITDNTFKFEREGIYTLRYIALDELYNYTFVDYKIEVTK